MNPYDDRWAYRADRGAEVDAYAADSYDPYRDYPDTYAADSYGADPYPRDSYHRDPYGREPHHHDSYARDRREPDPYARDTYAADPTGYGPAADPRQSSTGRASARATATVGSASAGRARVSGAAPVGSPPDDEPTARPRYDWSRAGAGASGRASVPVSPSPDSGPGGGTGRARVSPPGGPAGPGGTGPGGGRPGDGSAGPGRPARKKKRHWIRNSLLIGLAMITIMAGGGMVWLSYYVDSVPPPDALDLEEASVVRYADGEEMAVLQEVNREIIDTTVPELEHVRQAVVAAEDNNFYEHSGVDFLGIVRAFINNLRGGDRQGASTIDQQYARRAENIYEDTYARKLKEAAMAYKMNQEYSKDEILDFYLNTIYFGRGAHGIQAAAEAYFGKDAEDLSVGEAALLAGVIRVPDDTSGLSPYDPRNLPDDSATEQGGEGSGEEGSGDGGQGGALQEGDGEDTDGGAPDEEPVNTVALQRWNYVLDRMVAIGALDNAERAELTELPGTIDPQSTQSWHEGPQGNIVRQVRWELEEMGYTDLDTGGYRITTTIDPDIQQAALAAVRRAGGDEAGHWGNVPEEIAGALVAVDPTNGRIVAYYGGEDGTAYDLAGRNQRDDGSWYGGRPPGSTFKVYTLVAALREGVQIDSRWQTDNYDPGFGNEIHNAGRDAEFYGCSTPTYCTLRWSTVQSFNVPFFHFAERVPNQQGAARIVEAAHDAGISMMTDNNGNVTDLEGIEDFDSLGRDPFDYHVAFGQYPITVADHASGMATMAASGVYHEPHFVAKVEQKIDGEWQQIDGDKISGDPRITPERANTITDVLTEVPGANGHPLANRRPAAAKTGTWEHRDGGNADAWVVGYTPQIAAAVWVGDPAGGPISYTDGTSIGSGGLPFDIWKQFMDSAHAAKEYPPEPFPAPPPNPIGDPNSQLPNGERPERDDDDRDDDRGRRGNDDDQNCFPGLPCPDDDGESQPGDDQQGTVGGDGDETDGELGDNLFPGPGG